MVTSILKGELVVHDEGGLVGDGVSLLPGWRGGLSGRYVFILGRVDDVINVAGHRLSTGQMEEIVARHPAVAEAAVIGIPDELKGEVPHGFVVLKDGIDTPFEEVEEELLQAVRHDLGAIACFKNVTLVQRLPKTKSGKILRKTMRKMCEGKDVPVPPTIEDPACINELLEVIKKEGIGSYAKQGSTNAVA